MKKFICLLLAMLMIASAVACSNSSNVVDNKDTIVEMGEKYGVNPAILASVIFTEQSCNVSGGEGIVDLIAGFIMTTRK